MKIIVIPGRSPLRIRHCRVDGADHGRDVLPIPRVYLAARARAHERMLSSWKYGANPPN